MRFYRHEYGWALHVGPAGSLIVDVCRYDRSKWLVEVSWGWYR